MRPALVRRVAGLLAGLALVALVVGVLVSAVLLRGAALVQRVEPAGAVGALFGDTGSPGTPIGSPQRLIVRDEKAFLPGQGEDGVRYVSETYLRENGVYPLQVKTVELVRNLVVGASVAALLFFGGLWVWARRRMT